MKLITLLWVKGGRFGKSQQKLSLPQLPIFPRSFSLAPSDLISFVALANVALGPMSGAGAWIVTTGRVAFSGGVFPLLRTIVL
jgi:hypothetical protein